MGLSIYQVIMLALIAAALIVSWHFPRAFIWLLLIGASYLISSTWWRSDLPLPELVAGLCDAAICIGVLLMVRQQWELWVWAIFLASLGVNIVYLVNNLTEGLLSHGIYSAILEVLNVIAIFLIGLTSAFEAAGKTDGIAFRPWRALLGFVLPAARTRR